MPKRTEDDEPLHRAFGRRLAAARERRGFKVARRFAEKIGVGPARLSSWERGKAFPNNLSPLKRACEILGVTADYLLFGHTVGLSREAYEAVIAETEQAEADA